MRIVEAKPPSMITREPAGIDVGQVVPADSTLRVARPRASPCHSPASWE